MKDNFFHLFRMLLYHNSEKRRGRISISIDNSVNPGIIVLINKMLLFYNSPLGQFIPLKLKNHLI